MNYQDALKLAKDGYGMQFEGWDWYDYVCYVDGVFWKKNFSRGGRIIYVANTEDMIGQWRIFREAEKKKNGLDKEKLICLIKEYAINFSEMHLYKDNKVCKECAEETMEMIRKELGMEINFRDGIYFLHWKDGGPGKVAAVGLDKKGNYWFVTTDSVDGTPSRDWSKVLKADLITNQRIEKDKRNMI